MLALLLVCFCFAGCKKKDEKPIGPYEVEGSSSIESESSKETESSKESESDVFGGEVSVQIITGDEDDSDGEYFPGAW